VNFLRLLFIAVCSLLFLSCNSSLDASEVIVSRTFSFGDFDSIRANSSVKVYAAYGEEFSVTLSVNEDQWDFMNVSVQDGTLVFQYDSPKDYNNLQFTADVTLPNINRVHLYERASLFFYNRDLGTANRSLWDDSFAREGKVLEILLDGEYSHASFDEVVPIIPYGTFYLYSRSDFSAYNRTHTVNAREVVIHSEADNASSSLTIRSTYEPDIMILQGDL